MTRDTENLVRDLLSLYVKYGPSAFAEATAALSQGAVSLEIADVARELSRRTKDLPVHPEKVVRVEPNEIRSARKLTSRETTLKYIASLVNSNTPRDASVASFLQAIADRVVLDSPSLLKNYVDLLRLAPMSAHPDRYTMIRRIGEHLLGLLTDEEVRDKIREGRTMISPKSALEAWTNIIVKSDSQR